MVVTFFAVKPRSTACSRDRLLIISPALASNTSDKVICPATSRLRVENRRRGLKPPAELPVLSLSTSFKFGWDACVRGCSGSSGIPSKLERSAQREHRQFGGRL